MATIVQMPAPRARTDSFDGSQDGATILFFTGIRYVRDVETSEEEEAELPVAIALGMDMPENALALV